MGLRGERNDTISMTQEVRFGISIPNTFLEDQADLESTKHMIPQIERLGFHSIWVHDRIFHDNVNIIEPLTFLAYAAAQTSRVKIGTSVLLVPFRNPILFAKVVSSLDFLSSGRLILGLARGGTHTGIGDKEYDAFGIPKGKGGKVVVDAFNVAKRLWTETGVSQLNEHWRVENATMLPRPVQKPYPPVWLGGTSPGALKRVARFGDGWIASGGTTPTAFANGWKEIVRMAKEFGREEAVIEPANMVYVQVDEDKSHARNILAQRLSRYHNKNYDVDGKCVFGAADECARKLKEYVKAGSRTIILSLVDSRVDQLETIAKKVVPAV